MVGLVEGSRFRRASIHFSPLNFIFFLVSWYDLLRYFLRNLTLSLKFGKSESLGEWAVREFIALERELKIGCI